MLRPRPCRWFELVASRDELASVLAALAASGAVELQTHERRAAPLVVEGAAQALERYRALERRHAAHWPAARHDAALPEVRDPAGVLAARLTQLDAWQAEADAPIADDERLAAQQRALADVARLLDAGPALLPPAELLSVAGDATVGVRIHAGSALPPAHALPPDLLQLRVAAGDAIYAIVVGRRDALAAVDALFAAHQAHRIDWPEGLAGRAADAAHEVARRRQVLARQRAALAASLDALALRHDVAGARADIGVVEWLVRHGQEVSASERLVWVTGWTTAADPAALCAPLQRAGLRGVAQFPPPPAGAEAPSTLDNPPWLRTFEAFARLLGQPGRDEADPSPVVALVAPLLFGFMFGDVGQGAVLCIAGWALRRRVPTLVLLVPGGAMAILFGVLFGSVFAREDVIPALWLHPLHAPVTLLGAAVGLGAAILAAGLALAALEAHWRGATRRWWARDAGLVLAWGALLAAPFEPRALGLVAAGAAWFALGATATADTRRGAAFAAGLAHFVEQALQLVVNTVSFARVGAFALAHAGLSLAVVGIAEASGAIGYWIVLALGNLLILVLEGLVVGIQTTRLLLFEFFVRFLVGGGRAFRPLAPPLAPAVTASGSPS